MSVSSVSTKPHIAEWFFQPLLSQANRPFMWFLEQDRPKPMALKEAADWVSSYGRGLEALELARGERIVSLGAASASMWLSMIAHGLQGLVNVSVPISLEPKKQLQLITDSKSTALLADSFEHLYALLNEGALPAELQHVIILGSMNHSLPTVEGVKIMGVEDVQTLGRAQPDRTSQKLALCNPEETASILCFPASDEDLGFEDASFTVMKKTHADWMETYLGLIDLFAPTGYTPHEEVVLEMADWHDPGSYAATYIMPLLAGRTLGFLPEGANVIKALQDMQPSMLIANAERLEELKGAIEALIDEHSDWIERTLFKKALGLAKLKFESPENFKGWRKYLASTLQEVAVKNIGKRIGGSLKVILSVDEDTPYATQLFFFTFGIQLVEVPVAFQRQFEKRNW